jgi:thioredoxin reductase (NADPH)
MPVMTAVAIYALPAASIWGMYWLRRAMSRSRDVRTLADAQEAGLTEPASLHPIIDADRCIGCRACAMACPEGDILGIVEGKAVLVEPTLCIGHGACSAACPVGAIDLVFGTEKRGMDIPWVAPDFETNVPGVYIAGELGGMGLIRNAVTQGREAVEAIARKLPAKSASDDELDLLIVGAGPAGIAASLEATRVGLRFRTCEQDSLGGTVAHYPRGKIVMTEPAELPLYGKMDFRSVSKEQLIKVWTDVIAKTGVELSYGERVISVEKTATSFLVETSGGVFKAKNLLLAIGRRGSPRQLGVPGEDRAKVRYSLVDPDEYRGQRVLVVGGGDSALEAAIALADTKKVQTTLSYRGAAFTRARRANRESVERLAQSGALELVLESEVTEIGADKVVLSTKGRREELPNDVVIVSAGGILPIPLLEAIGVSIEKKFGTR